MTLAAALGKMPSLSRELSSGIFAQRAGIGSAIGKGDGPNRFEAQKVCVFGPPNTIAKTKAASTTAALSLVHPASALKVRSYQIDLRVIIPRMPVLRQGDLLSRGFVLAVSFPV